MCFCVEHHLLRHLDEIAQGLDGKHSVFSKLCWPNNLLPLFETQQASQLTNVGIIFCTIVIIKCVSLYAHLNLLL